MEINLLTPHNVVRGTSNRLLSVLKTFCGLFMAACLVWYGVYFYLDYRGRTQLAATQGDINRLQQVGGGLRNQGALRQAYIDKENLIRAVEGEKPVYTGFLEEMINLLPSGIQIINLEVKSTGVNQVEVNIHGEAPSHVAVAQFGRILEEAKTFKDAVIMVNRQDEGRKRVSFALRINPVKGSGQK
ncbi:MAG: PilN domain-containing protein [Clostridia bacterium]|nr:PilN domain-containing protein [Clostridia bacterium]